MIAVCLPFAAVEGYRVFVCVCVTLFQSGALCIPQRYVRHCLVVNADNVPYTKRIDG